MSDSVKIRGIRAEFFDGKTCRLATSTRKSDRIVVALDQNRDIAVFFENVIVAFSPDQPEALRIVKADRSDPKNFKTVILRPDVDGDYEVISSKKGTADLSATMPYSISDFYKKRDEEVVQHKTLPLTDADRECLMSIDEFYRDVMNLCFTSDDGIGYYATDEEVSDIPVNVGKMFEEGLEKGPWTHVVWYNK